MVCRSHRLYAVFLACPRTVFGGCRLCLHNFGGLHSRKLWWELYLLEFCHVAAMENSLRRQRASAYLSLLGSAQVIEDRGASLWVRAMTHPAQDSGLGRANPGGQVVCKQRTIVIVLLFPLLSTLHHMSDSSNLQIWLWPFSWPKSFNGSSLPTSLAVMNNFVFTKIPSEGKKAFCMPPRDYM